MKIKIWTDLSEITLNIHKFILYSIYFFSSNAVEILANKENEFMYYTKLGLRSTLFIQIVHCSSTFILLVISPKTNDYDQFWKNNVWVMMRFLALAVTIGFIFIGWQIQQSILNPLLSQQKRKNIIENRKKKDPNKQSIKIKFSKSVDDEPMYIDKKGSSSISDDSSASVISNNPSRITIETEEFISMKIKVKRKQLRLMWYIQFSILFVWLFDMLFSGIQFLFKNIRDCYSMTGVDMLDSLLYFITKFFGLILWTLPVIYVYWGREFYLSIKARRGDMADDEDDDEIDKYFEERPNERSQGIIKKSDNALVIKNRESKSQISSLT